MYYFIFNMPVSHSFVKRIFLIALIINICELFFYCASQMSWLFPEDFCVYPGAFFHVLWSISQDTRPLKGPTTTASSL